MINRVEKKRSDCRLYPKIRLLPNTNAAYLYVNHKIIWRAYAISSNQALPVISALLGKIYDLLFQERNNQMPGCTSRLDRKTTLQMKAVKLM